MLIEFLAPNVHNSIPRNRHFVLLLHFQLFFHVINKPDSSNYLAILMISLSYYIIFSFETINAVIRKAKFEGQPDQIIFFWIAASLSLMHLLLVLIALKHFYLMDSVHFSLKTNQFLVMVLKVCLHILSYFIGLIFW